MSRFTTIIPATGSHGNIFEIVGKARVLMRQLDVPSGEINKFTERVCATESYAAALEIVREWFPVDTGHDEDAEP